MLTLSGGAGKLYGKLDSLLSRSGPGQGNLSPEDLEEIEDEYLISKFSPGVYVNRKNGLPYNASMIVMDATNARVGSMMVLYSDRFNVHYVRELGEFLEKFDRI